MIEQFIKITNGGRKMDWRDSALLERQDRAGYTVLEALTPAALPSSPSSSRPGAYICVDGKTYWLKGTVQQGLVAELIAGRLAGSIGVGPVNKIIRLTEAAARPNEVHLHGIVAGSEDQPGTVNARELQPFVQSGQFQASLIDAQSRAQIVAFQTWIGVGDSQVLVSLTDGRIYSIDHGECFGNLPDPAGTLTVVVTDIPGVNPDVGRESVYVLPALDRIEAVTHETLLSAVAQVPSGDAWKSPTDRRLAIGRWLAERQAAMRGVMQSWMH